jgi:hypothetical protein
MSSLEEKTRALLASAKTALAEGFDRVENFAEPQEFKESLVKALDKHPDFRNAADEFHAYALTKVRAARVRAAEKIAPADLMQVPRWGGAKKRL